MKGIKKAAKKFIKNLDGQKVTVKSLEQYIKDEGYSIYEYLPGDGDNQITNLLYAIKKYDYAQTTSGFTYVDNNRKLLFIKKHLSHYEKMYVLAHEAGHIFLEHPAQEGIFVSNIKQENEANLFAQLILHQQSSHSIVAGSAVFASLIIITSAAIITNLPKNNTYSTESKEKTNIQHNVNYQYNVPENIYNEFDKNYRDYNNDYEVLITKTGTKYHLPQCRYAKGDNTTVIKLSEAIKLGYEPCKECEPDEEL